MDDFGAKVRNAREAMGWSQRETAKVLQCSAPFLSDVEHGRRKPKRWERVLGLQPSDLTQEDPCTTEKRLADLERRVRRLELSQPPSARQQGEQR